MDHELILEGPIPYFSTPEIWFAKCGCGTYATGKCASRSDAIKQHTAHVKAKIVTEVADKHQELLRRLGTRTVTDPVQQSGTELDDLKNLLEELSVQVDDLRTELDRTPRTGMAALWDGLFSMWGILVVAWIAIALMVIFGK